MSLSSTRSTIRPPTPAQHGSLIRIADFAGQIPRDADVRRILYTTRDAPDRPAVASALVITPKTQQTAARPVVVWNHGTTGVARGCAPSLRDALATKWAIPGLDEAIARGWVVVASDYSGQGAPGVFPYLIGLGEARSSLDAVLAARQIKGLTLRPDVVAWGHSQGGHAALWMSSKIMSQYAPQLKIVGTAVMAPAADPLALAAEVTSSGAVAPLSVLISWVLVPYADTYPDIDLDQYIAPGSRAIVREMTQRCPSEPGVMVSVVTALGVSEDRPLFNADLTSGRRALVSPRTRRPAHGTPRCWWRGATRTRSSLRASRSASWSASARRATACAGSSIRATATCRRSCRVVVPAIARELDRGPVPRHADPGRRLPALMR